MGAVLNINGWSQNNSKQTRIIELPKRFADAKILCSESGNYVAALFYDKCERKCDSIRYGARIEVWQLDESMRVKKMVFVDDKHTNGAVAIFHVIWVGENLIYAALCGFESFEAYLALIWDEGMKFWKLLEHYELRLWKDGLKCPRVVKKGVLGLIHSHLLLALPKRDEFLLFDPECEWAKVAMQIGRDNGKAFSHKYAWERIIQIYKVGLEGQVEVVRTIRVVGVLRNMKILGASPSGDALLVKTYRKQGDRDSYFGEPPWLVIDLRDGTVTPMQLKVRNESFFGMLPDGRLISEESDFQRVRVKYMCLKRKGKIYHAEVVMERVISYKEIERLLNFQVKRPLPLTWTPSGDALVLARGGKMWLLEMKPLRIRQLVEG
ncbi:MAG TPA: hypothetical protein EYP90_00505, partial [Chromatiaceae bacterium]|nr:hypothetical protein [Chromatiaceae bacterium]